MQQQQPKVKLTKKDYIEKKEKEQQLLNNSNNKANRDKDGKIMIEKNLQEKQNEILLNEIKKQNSGQGSEKTYTLVTNTLGQLEKKNDLDQYWVNNKDNYLSFITFLPNDNNELGASEESILFMNSDLSRLLKFKYNIFWSHCIYNKSLLEFLDSFLRFFKRDNQPIISLVPNSDNNDTKKGSKDFLESKRLLYRRVFLVLVRMSLQQEKSGNFITRDYYAELIYKQKLFTIPKMFDIVSLYATHSRDTITTMIQSLFDIQPLYYKDLFQQIQLISKSLFELNQSLLNRNVLDLLRLEDNYLMDIVYNLEQFIRIFPMGSHALLDDFLNNAENNGGILGWLVYFYEYMIPIWNKENQKSSNKSLNSSTYIPLKQYIQSIFHTIFRHNFMIKVEQLQLQIQDPCNLCKKSNIEEISSRFYSLLGNITSFSQEIIRSTKSNRSKLFNEYFDTIAGASILFDYEQTFKALSVFLEKLTSLDYSSTDQTNYFYFMQLIGKPVNDKQVQKPKKKPIPQPVNDSSTTTTSKPFLLNNPTILNTGKIEQVKSLFPDLGDWFVHSCLKFYNHSVEEVINALCDDSSLPPHLKSMDRSLSSDPMIIPPKATTTNITTTTTTTSTPPTVQSIDNSMNNLTIGKKSINFRDNSMDKVKAYIKNYENIYDDEYDDSLEEFAGFSVQDGEKYNNNDDIVGDDDNYDDGNNKGANNNNNNNGSNNSNNINNKGKNNNHNIQDKILPSNAPRHKLGNNSNNNSRFNATTGQNKRDDNRNKQQQQDNKPAPPKQQPPQQSKPAAPKQPLQQDNKPAAPKQQQQPQPQDNKPAASKQQQDNRPPKQAKPKQQPAAAPKQSSKPKTGEKQNK